MMYLIADAFQIAAEAAGESTAAGKALAVASTVISTWQTAQLAYASAQKAYESQLSIPTIDAPVRAKIAAGIAIVSGLMNVKNHIQIQLRPLYLKFRFHRIFPICNHSSNHQEESTLWSHP